MRSFFLVIFLYFFCSASFASLPFFPITFPRDEGAHYKNVPYNFKLLTEWWYFNGKLTTEQGKHLSYDIAFFHPALQFNSVITQPILHIQVADLDSKKSYGTNTIYFTNTGSVSTKKLDINMKNDYLLQQQIVNAKPVYILRAQGHEGATDIKLDLTLEPTAEVFLINKNGLLPMPNDTNSYYYTIPHFSTAGSIEINGTQYQAKMGDSWMDHQWGDFDVTRNGWEWFGIRLKNGLVANIFLNVAYNNLKVTDGLANIILPNGEKHFIAFKDFKVSRDNYWFDEKLSINYPMVFTFSFPSLGLEMKSTALFPEQEINRYWEGYCNVSALYNKEAVEGFSYTELVYTRPLFA